MCAASKADYERLDVPGLLRAVDPDVHSFASVLHEKADELIATGDALGAEVLSLLSAVCSYGMRADNVREPFGPQLVLEDRRSPSIEDLGDSEIDLLGEIHDQIPIAELRARVADVLFVRRRHHNFGKVAIDAYLESASHLMTPDKWAKASYRFERALMVAVGVKSERDRVVARIVEELEKRRGDGGYFSAKMMAPLFEYRFADPAAMVPLAEAAAKKGADDGDWDRAREYYLVLAQWCRRAGKAAEDVQARSDAAECYVKLADQATSRSLEASFLERAIQSLRAISGTQTRVEELHLRLVAAQKEAPKEFKEFSSAVDLGDAPAAARAQVAGVDLQNAIFRLAMVWRSEPIERIEHAVIETAKQAVFLNAMPRVQVNRDGKVVAKRGSLIVGDPKSRADSLRGAMFERANQARDYIAVSVLRPARAQIAEEHFVSARSLLPLTTASAFVPPGREEIFALGLAAGFAGDFAVALHLLMPQFEHAIRTILANSGTLTSKVDEDGIQDERDLGWLLTCEDAKRVFGAHLLFDMRGLLVERFGGNLRNLMAHGLLDTGLMIGSQSIYFWWLTLHMVVRPVLATLNGPGVEVDEEAGAGGANAGEDAEAGDGGVALPQ